jgi:hypothetical protein
MSEKKFKLMSVSTASNTFGLWGHIFVAQDGETWEFGLTDPANKGTIETLKIIEGYPQWQEIGAIAPHRLEDCPPEGIKQIWG